MYTYQTKNAIAQVGLAQLSAAHFQRDDAAADPEAILVRSANMLEDPVNPSLLCVARAGAGYNNIPVDRFAEAGVVVFNTPGANSNAVKELAVCALLLASRDILGGIDWCRTLEGRGAEVPKLVEQGKSAFIGPELTGKTLGLVGLGAVGAKVAKAAHALGMRVLGVDPFLSDALRRELEGVVEVVADQATLFPQCDYISLHLPYHASTKDTIRAETIASMKDGARIINIARGELVCDADVAAALASGKLSRYVTDFPNAATVAMPGCIAIPHLGASTPESEDNCAVMAAQQVQEYLLQGNIVNSVNLPNLRMERGGTYRTVVIAKADADLPLRGKSVAEKTRGGYKVILADDDTPCDAAALRALPGVIRVRTL